MNQRFMDSEAEITHASSISPGSCYTHKISGESYKYMLSYNFNQSDVSLICGFSQ